MNELFETPGGAIDLSLITWIKAFNSTGDEWCCTLDLVSKWSARTVVIVCTGEGAETEAKAWKQRIMFARVQQLRRDKPMSFAEIMLNVMIAVKRITGPLSRAYRRIIPASGKLGE